MESDTDEIVQSEVGSGTMWNTLLARSSQPLFHPYEADIMIVSIFQIRKLRL